MANVEMVVFSPKVQCFYFCGTSSHGNDSTLCLCNSVNYVCTVTNTLEGWRI